MGTEKEVTGMETYYIEIVDTHSYCVEVEAEDEEHARNIGEDMVFYYDDREREVYLEGEVMERHEVTVENQLAAEVG